MSVPVKLLADIGGTNARFALHADGVTREIRVLACAEHPSFASALRAYLRDVDAETDEAAIAIAAPLQGDAVRMTNCPWQFSIAEVRRELGWRRVRVLNDFTALALAIPRLPAAELTQVGGATGVDGAPMALLGPGTGLGVSGLVRGERHWIPLQGEGGHATLAASDEREAAVLAILRKRFGHVSAERVLTGSGLVFLNESLCALEGRVAPEYTPAQIVESALEGGDARPALEMFCAMLGTMASNLALTLGAFGGVYVGGGIVPRFVDFFARSGFRARFEDKGRYKDYLASIPVYVICTAMPAFVGLARAFSDPAPSIVAED